MYCIKCGVELADSERVCPLCGTRVFHPDLPCGQGEPPYPPADHPRHEEVSRIGVLFVISVCMLLPAVITVLCDWRINGTIVWSGFAVGGLLLLYILAVLPLWFKRPNPVIFVPIDFAAIGVFLLYVNYATGGHWFLTFALPVTGAAGLLVCAMGDAAAVSARRGAVHLRRGADPVRRHGGVGGVSAEPDLRPARDVPLVLLPAGGGGGAGGHAAGHRHVQAPAAQPAP